MIRPTVSLLAALTALALPPVFQAQEHESFTPLFNGRDLTGWRNINCAPGTFTVRDGEIYSTGAPICEIRTERMYENFVLELEYQHLKAGGNAGVFVWADALPARGEPFLRAIEVQVLDGHETANYTSHGDVFAIHGAVMTPDRPHPGGWMRSLPKERRAKPAGEWNHYRITADKGVITLAVNGQAVSGGHDISPRKGYIALESEGSPVRFRNLRLRELPSAGALPEGQTAQADTGFVSLYNGLDLSGWRQRDRMLRWKADDWTLKAQGPNAPASGDLVSDAQYGDVTVMYDWRVTKPTPPESWARPTPRTASGPSPRVMVMPTDGPHEPTGRWNRVFQTKKGDLLSLTVNGRTVVTNLKTIETGERGLEGPLVIRHIEGIEYANIFVRRLP